MPHRESTLGRFRAYQVALRVVGEIERTLPQFPRGHAVLRNQLTRASQSALLNIAEGAGRVLQGEKRRSFVTARGETAECRAALQVSRETCNSSLTVCFVGSTSNSTNSEPSLPG